MVPETSLIAAGPRCAYVCLFVGLHTSVSMCMLMRMCLFMYLCVLQMRTPVSTLLRVNARVVCPFTFAVVDAYVRMYAH